MAISPTRKIFRRANPIICRFTCALLGLVTAVSVDAQELACNQPLYATNLNGTPTHGSKDALIEAVNSGEPIRVGWGLDFDEDGKSELLHWADAAFLSVWEGEVFTQVDGIHTQSPVRGQGNVTLREAFVEWRGSIGTNGKLEGRASDGTSFPNVRKVETAWCSTSKREQRWVLLYRNGLLGEDLAGSKDSLLAAVRSGYPIQIGWGVSVERGGRTVSVEHLVSPVFTSITNGTEVTAQLPEHIAQKSYSDVAQSLFDDPSVMWRGLMTTEGTFDAAWVDRATGQTVRRVPQRAVLSWFAPAAPELSTDSLAIQGGVTLDEARSSERVPTTNGPN